MTAARKFQTVPIEELNKLGLQPDSSPKRPVVLVVDDEKIIADTLVAILNQAGFASAAAYSAASAIEMASIIPPDLLLTDIVMPGMNGVDLAEAIQQTIPDCRIVMFSGQASTVDYLSLGRTFRTRVELLAKPIAPRELISALTQLLAPAT